MGILAMIRHRMRETQRRRRLAYIAERIAELDVREFEAKARAGLPSSETLARCDVAAVRLAALGNKLYPDIHWRPYDERVNPLAQVRIVLSCHDFACVELVSLEVAEWEDKVSIVQMLAIDFIERAQALADNIHAGKKERAKWLTPPSR